MDRKKFQVKFIIKNFYDNNSNQSHPYFYSPLSNSDKHSKRFRLVQFFVYTIKLVQNDPNVYVICPQDEIAFPLFSLALRLHFTTPEHIPQKTQTNTQRVTFKTYTYVWASTMCVYLVYYALNGPTHMFFAGIEEVERWDESVAFGYAIPELPQSSINFERIVVLELFFFRRMGVWIFV